MSKSNKLREIKGWMYEEQGPWCELCDTHMGKTLYCSTIPYDNDLGLKAFEPDPNTSWKGYFGGTCPKCGQEYTYEEMCVIELTEDQLNLLRKDKGLI